MTRPSPISGLLIEPRFPVGALVSLCLIVGIFAALLALAATGVGLIEW